MPTTKKWLAALLSRGQAVLALFFSGSYYLRSLEDVTGSSVVFFVLAGMYLALNWRLAYNAPQDKKAPEIRRQVLFLYGVRFALVLMIIGAIAIHPDYQWNSREWAQFLSALLCVVIVGAVMFFSGRGISDPMVKALLSIGFVSVAQLLFANKIWLEGGSGTPAVAIWSSHASFALRLPHLYIFGKEKKGDPGRKWIFFSEIANWATWLVVTVVWLGRT